jgi:thioesterase domain-containing protein
MITLGCGALVALEAALRLREEGEEVNGRLAVRVRAQRICDACVKKFEEDTMCFLLRCSLWMIGGFISFT